MIVALFALAATLIVAGITAVVEGFPYVRIESGMAMVYGGSVVGSSGFLLLGLAVVASGLKRVERAVRSGPALASDPAPAADEPRREPSPEFTHDSLADEFQIIAPTPTERPRIEPSLIPVVGRDEVRHKVGEPDLVASDLSLIDLAEKAPEPAPKPVVPVVEHPVPPAPVNSPGIAPLRSSLDVEPERVAERAPEERIERTPVGRYSSGGNTYVMFDDGAIEADTPNGRFTFGSLDELKAFVDGGGERSARGAA